MFDRLRAYFLTGLVVSAPILITVYLTWLFIDTVDEIVVRNLPPRYNPETYLAFSIPGLGVLIMVAALTLVGALAANFAGRTIIRMGERVLHGTPIIRSVYSTLKQIAETIMAQHSDTFRSVVLVEYPRKGLWALAFVSTPAKGEIQDKTSEETLNVFLPTTPNPTSGYLLFVPRQDCIFLDMTVEEAVKYIISAGLVAPSDDPDDLASRLNRKNRRRVGESNGQDVTQR
ncbi:MAG: DUF502 domain-containing protein [Rhodothalassiaceae bacterium]